MKLLRQILVAAVGGTVLLVGVAMIVLPGPAIVVIPAGLAILATEFAWARHWLRASREYVAKKLSGKGAAEAKRQELPLGLPVRRMDSDVP